MSDDPTFEQAMDLARQWHYSTIRRIADDAIEACAGRLVMADLADEAVARDAELEGREGIRDALITQGRKTKRINRERERNVDPQEFLTEYVDSATDDHNHVIYTGKAWMVCLASDNDDAYEDDIGEPAPNISAQACYAMRRDVWDLLNARSDEWEQVKCEECDEEIDHVDGAEAVCDDHEDFCSFHPSQPDPDDVSGGEA